MRIATLALLGAATIGLAACDKSGVETGTPTVNGARAVAMVKNAQGVDIGRATATEVAGGLRFTFDARALPPGTHGVHVHTTGQCDAPAYTTAGGHWNPSGSKHGSMNPQGPHAGDMPNLIIGTDGRGTVGVTIPGATMAGLMDADGSAFVVHAGPDDLMTDPAGNSGGRIACGVFAAS